MVLAEGKCLHRAALLVPLSLLRAAPAPREAVAVLGTSVGFGPEKEQEVGMPGDITQVGCAAAGLLAASQRVGAALVPSTLLSSAEPLQGLLVPCLLCPGTVPLVTCLGSCPSCDMLSPAALCPFSPSLGSCCSWGSAAHGPPGDAVLGAPGSLCSPSCAPACHLAGQMLHELCSLLPSEAVDFQGGGCEGSRGAEQPPAGLALGSWCCAVPEPRPDPAPALLHAARWRSLGFYGEARGVYGNRLYRSD